MKYRTVLMALLFATIAGGAIAVEGDKDSSDKAADKIRVAIITERSGPHLGIYFKSLAGCKGVSKVALCDESGRHFAGAQRTLGKVFGKVSTYRKPATMIGEFKPQLVIVAMPAHLSPAPIKVAMEGGCNVVSEKPGCIRAEQFAELVKLARLKKRLLMLSLPNRVSAQSLRARQIIQQGFLGKLYAVNVLQVKDQTRLTRPSYQKSWYCSRDKSGGGHLIWLGIHNMDQVLFLTGDRVEKVSAFCRNVGGQPIKIEDAEAVSLLFKSGMVGTFHGGYFLKSGSMQNGLTIWGSKGWIKIAAHRSPGGSASSFKWYSTHPKAPKGIQTEKPTSKVGGYQGFVQAAIDATRGARPTPLTAEDSLEVLKVIYAAYKSSETGTVQKVE
ncbi:MAG: Gfo/Idh/MocA family oxidoreductase [Phycisphaerae bacterium]|jgi:predicted dehydrogenase|nr:Gfo/Idh/MocA family oxidoreductase [Phycisphaerae bacterium]